jgi:hypothetical protein
MSKTKPDETSREKIACIVAEMNESLRAKYREIRKLFTMIRSRFANPGIPDRERAAIRTAVEKRAYEIWEEEGRLPGHEQAHWFQAKADLGIAKDIYV